MRKRRYYEGGAMHPRLAARYWRFFAGSRRVLDLGCGRGDFGRLRPDPSVEVFGLDHDAGAVAEASRYEVASQLDLAGEGLPFEPATFDGVFAKDILEHLADSARMVGEIARVMRPRGRLLVSVPMEYPWVVWQDYTHFRGFTRASLRLMLEDHGFEVVHIAPMGEVPGAGRLGLVDAVPAILSVPGLRRVFGRSWEALALRG